MIELARSAPSSAQWSEAQFLEMFAGGAADRIILVVAGAEDSVPNDSKKGNAGPSLTRVQGFAVAHRVGNECEIENIVVNPESQRKGLGRILLEELLNRVQQVRCEAVFLEVRESNAAARGLYEKCGFREVGRRVKYYAQPQEDAAVYRFSRDEFASGTVQTSVIRGG
jgi:ribosomal-protein-alanine acetyltransferase